MRGGPRPREIPMPVFPHPYGTFLALGVIVGGLAYLFCLAVRMEDQ